MSKSNTIKRVVLLGKKLGAAKALKWLLANNIEVAFVVAKNDDQHKNSLKNLAIEHGIPTYSDDREIYEMIRSKDKLTQDIDLVISYLYWKRIKEPLINLGKNGCINFHPAPLPDYKSRAGYNTAILAGDKNFGVSAHFIDSEELDAGPIIEVARFDINPDDENAHSLESKTQKKLFTLFTRNMRKFINGEKIDTYPNSGGLYLNSDQLEAMKIVNIESDSGEEINRKIRAFFFPPYTGAKILIKGEEYTVLNKQIMNYIDSLMKKR